MNLYSQKYGFVIPAILFFVVAFVSVPVLFWLFTAKPFSSNVKGASTVNAIPSGTGIYVKIKSPFSMWDMNVYLCKDKDECSKSLLSGKQYFTVSGGKGDERLIPILYSDAWKDNTYLKVFVKTGWGSSSKTFTPNYPSNVELLNAKDGQAILIPVLESSSSMVGPLSFSEN